MRIAMIGPFGFHPNKTMRARAFRLARALVGRGHAVRLVMPPWQTPEQAARRWDEAGVELQYVALHGGVAGIVARMVRETLTWQPDVVHAFKPKAYSGLAAWWLWQFYRRRCGLVTDSDDWEGAGGWNERAPYSPAQKLFFSWQERWGLRHHHALTVASRALETLAWGHGAPPERVIYLANGPGIEPDGDGAARRSALGLAGRPVVLLYSRLFEFDTGRLVAILRQVQTAVPDLAILSVGAGLFDDEAARWQAQLAAAGLLPAIVDAGWVDEAALPELLAAADVGLYLIDDNLLNRTKCPVKLADMLAAGRPVVAEAVGQTPEYVVHEQTGLLYPTGDVAGVATGVITLLQDPAHRARLGSAARQHIAARFSWPRLAERAEIAYRLAAR